MSAFKVFFGVFYALWFAWLVFFFLVVSLSQYDARTVRRVCVAHQGVAQVQDNTFFGGAGKATVVCRDGWAGNVK